MFTDSYTGVLFLTAVRKPISLKIRNVVLYGNPYCITLHTLAIIN